MSTPDLEAMVRAGASRQVVLDRAGGIPCIFLGVLFTVLSIFVEGKADEQTGRLAAGVFGVLNLAFGVAYLRFRASRLARLRELLVKQRTELKEPTIIERRQRGNVIGHAIQVTDRANRRYRMVVASEADARAILSGITP